MVSWLLATFAFLFLLKIQQRNLRFLILCWVPLGVVIFDWVSLKSDYEHILSYPFSDAHGYFNYGMGLAKNLPIGLWGGRRPLYSSFLSSLFTIFGSRLFLILLFQALLWGFCATVFDSVLLRRYGKTTAAFMLYIILIFGTRFFGNTLT